MAIFSRKKSSPPAQPSRRQTLDEAQAQELRTRARRRLIGALILVLAAVVIVPMVFDGSDPADAPATPIVLPASMPPRPDIASAPDVFLPDAHTQGLVDEPAELLPTEASGSAPAETPSAAAPAASQSGPAPAQAAATPRTDDGSLALALLEGRNPELAQGSHVLQIAAYSTDADAQARRQRLLEAGVGNAFVEKGDSSGKTVFRLKVGPFPSDEAARAAQARLRSLGYDNSLLLSR